MVWGTLEDLLRAHYPQYWPQNNFQSREKKFSKSTFFHFFSFFFFFFQISESFGKNDFFRPFFFSVKNGLGKP